MNPRTRSILRRAHMAGVAQMPAVSSASAEELEAISGFVLHCAVHRVTAPDVADLRAHCALDRPAPSTLQALAQGLEILGFTPALIAAAERASQEQALRANFRGYNHGARRDYRRTVSVGPDQLPIEWQQVLQQLRRDEAHSPEILKRMEHRLGMFAWSALRAGLPVDLENSEAECAFYDDLIQRSRGRAIKKGEDPDDAAPRWAYMRTAAEEFCRFGKYLGVTPESGDRLDRNYRGFCMLEARQTPLKMFTSLQAPELPVTLAGVCRDLQNARTLAGPDRRHQARLKACAIGITLACPPRAQDVVENLIWGKGVFYEAEADRYCFNYIQHKTNVRLHVKFEQRFSMFFESLLLGDNDPRYLPALRDQALQERRPLFMRYDGEPAAYGWIGRTWDAAIRAGSDGKTGSGSHLARTILQTFLADLGEDGFAYGRTGLGHRSFRQLESYRDDNARRRAASCAAAAADACAAPFDDISNLI